MAWAIGEDGKPFEVTVRATGIVWPKKALAELVKHVVRKSRARLFKQSDVTRALKAVKSAGVDARVEIAPDGKLSIIPTGAEDAPKINPWDEVLDKPQAKTRPRLS